MFVCIKKSIVMDISLRTQQLNSLFSYDKKAHLEESRLEIIPFRFTQTIGASEINEFQKGLAATEFCSVTEDVYKRQVLHGAYQYITDPVFRHTQYISDYSVRPN